VAEVDEASGAAGCDLAGLAVYKSEMVEQIVCSEDKAQSECRVEMEM
jgi:hypothetical protein